MQYVKFLGIGLCSFFSCITHAQELVPAQFASVEVDAGDVYAFVQKCSPDRSDADFDKMVREAGSGATVSIWPKEKTAPVLAVNKRRVFCIQRSEGGYPILPLDFFEKTIEFKDMTPDEKFRFHQGLSQQLSRIGYATTLVVYGNGNASDVLYMFASEKPSRVYYRASFLKAGTFDESRYAHVYRAPGRMSVVTRSAAVSKSPENYKSFYDQSSDDSLR